MTATISSARFRFEATFEMLTGKKLFDARNVSEMLTSVLLPLMILCLLHTA